MLLFYILKKLNSINKTRVRRKETETQSLKQLNANTFQMNNMMTLRGWGEGS